VYSIAPFLYARPFEQIRNDVCLNRLPVHLIGNGGGYAYGSMGATHHALEDYGVLLTLAGMRAYVPAFDADVEPMVRAMAGRDKPAYLRLGRSDLNDESRLPPYSAWRRLQDGRAGVLVCVGPIAGGLWEATRERAAGDRPAIWVVGELEGDGRAVPPPPEMLEELDAAPILGIVEEHVAHGGFGQQFMHFLAVSGRAARAVTHAHAEGYPSGRYGSQRWHRRECGLDVGAILGKLDRSR
jgi:transketolase